MTRDCGQSNTLNASGKVACDVFICESQDKISTFSKVGVLPAITCSGTRSIMPIDTIALDDDMRCTQQKVNHKLTEHHGLFLIGDRCIIQSGGHRYLYIRSLDRGKAFQVPKVPMLLTAVFPATIFSAAWVGIKHAAAIVANDRNLWLKLWTCGASLAARAANEVKRVRATCKSTTPRTDRVAVGYGSQYSELLATDWTNLVNRWGGRYLAFPGAILFTSFNTCRRSIDLLSAIKTRENAPFMGSKISTTVAAILHGLALSVKPLAAILAYRIDRSPACLSKTRMGTIAGFGAAAVKANTTIEAGMPCHLDTPLLRVNLLVSKVGRTATGPVLVSRRPIDYSPTSIISPTGKVA